MVVLNAAPKEKIPPGPAQRAEIYKERVFDVGGSAGGVVATLIGGLVDEAAAQVKGYRQSDNPEALHDLRVSLRRLNSNLRTYQNVLGKEWVSKAVHELKDLMRQTSVARDLEVEVALLEELQPKLRVNQRGALKAIASSLRSSLKAHAYRPSESIVGNLERHLDQLSSSLAKGATGTKAETRFDLVFGNKVADLFDNMEQIMKAALKSPKERSLHDLRIAAKKMRYLLAPFDDYDPRIKKHVGAMEKLQNLLGRIHDLQVLRKTVAGSAQHIQSLPGYKPLLKLLDRQEASLLRQFKRDWRGSKKKEFHNSLANFYSEPFHAAIALSDWSSQVSVELKARQLLRAVKALRSHAKKLEKRFASEIDAIPSREGKLSAKNLLHYLALRQFDLRPLQRDLARFGASSLGRLESHTMASLEAVINVLSRLANKQLRFSSGEPDYLSMESGRALLEARAERALGHRPEHSAVRVMVTMPSAAAKDYDLVKKLVGAGMNVARINCAHDTPVEWKKMIAHVKRAREECGRGCLIMADLAGPKLRTGSMQPGPQVVKIRPWRDRDTGTLIRPARILLDGRNSAVEGIVADACLPVSATFLKKLSVGQRIRLTDNRGSQRVWEVKEIAPEGVWVESKRRAWIKTGTKLVTKVGNQTFEGAVGRLPPVEQGISLRVGDELILTRTLEPGAPARMNKEGDVLEPGRIPCTLPAVFKSAKAGQRIYFDDGKIAGLIKTVTSQQIKVEIVAVPEGSAKLRSEKGINLPDTKLDLPSLTPKDQRDARSLADEVDGFVLSWTRGPGDVKSFARFLDKLNVPGVSMGLKIETGEGFEQMSRILLGALATGRPSVIWIARGDGAVEMGHGRYAEVQEEMLWLCEAAGLPSNWCTQVMETTAKTGLISRPEVTDAAMGGRAECVMLNKGEHIVEVVRLLSEIFSRMKEHQEKKMSLLRALRVAAEFCVERA